MKHIEPASGGLASAKKQNEIIREVQRTQKMRGGINTFISNTNSGIAIATKMPPLLIDDKYILDMLFNSSTRVIRGCDRKEGELDDIWRVRAMHVALGDKTDRFHKIMQGLNIRGEYYVGWLTDAGVPGVALRAHDGTPIVAPRIARVGQWGDVFLLDPSDEIASTIDTDKVCLLNIWHDAHFFVPAKNGNPERDGRIYFVPGAVPANIPEGQQVILCKGDMRGDPSLANIDTAIFHENCEHRPCVWVPLFILFGSLDQRPDANDVLAGTVWVDTVTGNASYSTGAVWTDLSWGVPKGLKLLSSTFTPPSTYLYRGLLTAWVQEQPVNCPAYSVGMSPRMGMCGFRYNYLGFDYEIFGTGRTLGSSGSGDYKWDDMYSCIWDVIGQKLDFTLHTTPFTGFGRSHAIGCSVNRGTDLSPDWWGYVGLGFQTGTPPTYFDDMHEFHNGSWSTMSPVFPVATAAAVAGFVEGVKDTTPYKFLVVGSGITTSDRWWFYDISSISPDWVEIIADYEPSARNSAIAFTLPNPETGLLALFAGLGISTNCRNDLHMLTVEWDSKSSLWVWFWTTKASLPDLPRESATAIYDPADTTATVMLGNYYKNNSPHCLNSVWLYDSILNVWHLQPPFAGMKRAAAFGFSLGGKSHIIGGRDMMDVVGQDFNDVWTENTNYLMEKDP